ncbi:MAG TPA: aldo/keto reductase [Bacteroidota bacterium]|nr:aldo/keto reductase [Bacteroidota bacterium]
MLKGISRRSFFRSMIAGGTLAAVSRHIGSAGQSAPGAPGAMPTRPLGKTGVQLTLFSLGGQCALEHASDHDAALAIIDRALVLGVNCIDTAPSYGNGASERRVGEALKGRRKGIFIATKTDDRSYDGAMRSLEGSLKRLQTDQIDLWQIHNILNPSDVDFMLSREGAVRALEKAREEHVVRFIGITGHRDPFLLKRAIEQHPFDAMLVSVNAADRHVNSFIDHLLPAAVARGVGIMAMKVPARGRIFRSSGIRTMEQAMHYSLTQPVSTAVIGISSQGEVEENARIAAQFSPLTADEMAAMEALTLPYYPDALWYREHM